MKKDAHSGTQLKAFHGLKHLNSRAWLALCDSDWLQKEEVTLKAVFFFILETYSG